LLEADETFIGGRGDPTSRGRSTANPDKSLVVAAGRCFKACRTRRVMNGYRSEWHGRAFARLGHSSRFRAMLAFLGSCYLGAWDWSSIVGSRA
jgi:hypothetical protein